MNQYECIESIGEGTYGVVLKCRHRRTGRIVAVKRFKNAGSHEYVRCTMLRELRVEQLLTGEPQIVKLVDAFQEGGSLYLVMEYIPYNLLDVLDRSPQGLRTDAIRLLLYTLLLGVQSCHSNGIIHRDIKPENILVKDDGCAALCDFGFSRPITLGVIPAGRTASPHTLASRDGSPLLLRHPARRGSTQSTPAARSTSSPLDDLLLSHHTTTMTDYVATRWYRSPEMLLGMSLYDYAVDMWAVGAIMAEAADGQPLLPGKTELEQLSLIQTRVGDYPASYHALVRKRNGGAILKASDSGHNPLTGASPSKGIIREADGTPSAYLEKRFSHVLGESGLDLLSRLLIVDARKRITVEEALRHPFLESAVAEYDRLASAVEGEEEKEEHAMLDRSVSSVNSSSSSAPRKKCGIIHVVGDAQQLPPLQAEEEWVLEASAIEGEEPTDEPRLLSASPLIGVETGKTTSVVDIVPLRGNAQNPQKPEVRMLPAAKMVDITAVANTRPAVLEEVTTGEESNEVIGSQSSPYGDPLFDRDTRCSPLGKEDALPASSIKGKIKQAISTVLNTRGILLPSAMSNHPPRVATQQQGGINGSRAAAAGGGGAATTRRVSISQTEQRAPVLMKGSPKKCDKPQKPSVRPPPVSHRAAMSPYSISPLLRPAQKSGRASKYGSSSARKDKPKLLKEIEKLSQGPSKPPRAINSNRTIDVSAEQAHFAGSKTERVANKSTSSNNNGASTHSSPEQNTTRSPPVCALPRPLDLPQSRVTPSKTQQRTTKADSDTEPHVPSLYFRPRHTSSPLLPPSFFAESQSAGGGPVAAPGRLAPMSGSGSSRPPPALVKQSGGSHRASPSSQDLSYLQRLADATARLSRGGSSRSSSRCVVSSPMAEPQKCSDDSPVRQRRLSNSCTSVKAADEDDGEDPLNNSISMVSPSRGDHHLHRVSRDMPRGVVAEVRGLSMEAESTSDVSVLDIPPSVNHRRMGEGTTPSMSTTTLPSASHLGGLSLDSVCRFQLERNLGKKKGRLILGD